MSDQRLSQDWPASVHPPEAETFEQTAIVWLFDNVPADYRLHGVLRRHPVALARLARQHVAACLEGARQGYRTARVDLRDFLPPHAVEQVMNAYLAEGRRMAATLRSIELVDDALRDTALRAGRAEERDGASAGSG
ncbi:hypothetical protein [Marinitenerispora sediminis]|uniref:Uncharacterized protein n=1 Tax=Marinitenerispora sediminis TaxID=1931232 RepID=A0A368T9J5_9ACTN|nr:hypothetical protein [Marinitenerispora sediminis]RCV55168.1 hypothetical protein DEF28_06595 [Marinitenerispora sediminis]RCV61254.1 hypothetical protein DEF24_04765 [Marinitenerispora sediminis]RCV61525.1 hypothetical protein DEF23_02080 [Marinitenerispora sediminis]